MGNSWPGMILASDRVPANLKKLNNHAYPITQWVRTIRFRVRPINGNFHDSQPSLFGRIQYLRINPPSPNLLLREHQLSRRPAESFKSALRIFVVQSQDQP